MSLGHGMLAKDTCRYPVSEIQSLSLDGKWRYIAPLQSPFAPRAGQTIDHQNTRDRSVLEAKESSYAWKECILTVRTMTCVTLHDSELAVWQCSSVISAIQGQPSSLILSKTSCLMKEMEANKVSDTQKDPSVATVPCWKIKFFLRLNKPWCLELTP
jgi:hypothetical protein